MQAILQIVAGLLRGSRLGALVPACARSASRLYLAFGLAAGMTVVGSLFALFASANYQRDLERNRLRAACRRPWNRFGCRRIPATLIASAPRLMAVEDESQRSKIASEIATQSQAVSRRGSSGLRALDASQSDEIANGASRHGERLDALNQAVADRIKISAQRRALALAVRKAHENLLEAITPAIDDANFDLMTQKPGRRGQDD